MSDTPSSRKPVVVIRKREIVQYYTMAEAIESMAVAFAGLSSGSVHVPERYIINSRDDALTFLLKPAFRDNQDQSAIKVLTQKNAGPLPGIPTILGIVMLIDNKTGEILAIMDGEYITALRTGAASGLATDFLARPDARNAAIFGCGTQGRTQIEAVDAVRELHKVWIFDQVRAQAESFVQDMQDKISAKLEITSELSVLKEVDIICTATYAQNPLFYKKHIKAGTHINAIGSFKPEMQELDPEIILSSRIYLDDKEACMKESGDLLRAARTGDLPAHIVGEIGECILQTIPKRTSPSEVTLFKSVGTAIQDLVIADEIFKKSRLEHFGEEIRLYE